MNKKYILQCVAALAAILFAPFLRADAPPNILFFLTEDQGAQLGFLGTAGLETPHMDRLAEEGVYFDQAFVNYPVCSPSKANIYTGLYCHTNGVMGLTTNFHGPAGAMPKALREHDLTVRLRVRDDVPTLVELLRDAGYHTALSFKLHVQPNEKFPYHQWVQGNPGYANSFGVFRRAEKEKKPFFYFANISEPHRPYRNSDEVDIGVSPDEVEPPPFLPDTEECRKDWAEYIAHVEQADRVVGEVLRALRDSGQEENTLIVFMGDHGAPYHRGKMALYDFGIRVPMAIAGKGVQGERRTRELISAIDLLPTLMEMAGLEDLTPAFQQGRSVAAFLRGENESTGNEYIFSEIDNGALIRPDGKGMQERSVYDGRWKLIYRENRTQPRQVNADLKFFRHPNPKVPVQGNRVYDEIVIRRDEFPREFELLAQIDNGTLMPGVPLPQFELYDLETDPWEFKNLADDPDVQEELNRLLRVLQQWSVETIDAYTALKSFSSEVDVLREQLRQLD